MPEKLRGGCLRATRDDGTKVVVCPRDPMYSTVLMFATERWDAETQTWVPIFPPDEAPEQSP